MLLHRGTGDVGMKSLTTLTENKPLMWRGSVGDDLEHLEKDRAIHTDPEETRRRRTIKLHRDKNTWGFTLQTYGIKNKKTNELEVMTYVDYVELNGPAGLAGMRRGDVILSVNGETVEGLAHKVLVKRIQEINGVTLRLVVLFEDCCRKVELYERFIKLKQILKMKLEEYRHLEKKEHLILEGNGGFSRLSSVRSSLRSSSSSDWDRFSMVVSPAQMLQNLPTRPSLVQHFLFPRSYASSQDDSSELFFTDVALNDSFSDDSDPFLNSSASCSDIVSLQGLRKSKIDSLSNKSVSSLITNAEIRRDMEKGYSSDAEPSPIESLPDEGSTKGDNSENNDTNSEYTKSERIVFCINPDEDDFSNSATVPAVENNLVKGDNQGNEIKEDNPDNDPVPLDTSDLEGLNQKSECGPGLDRYISSGFDYSKGDNSTTEGEKTTDTSPPNHPKRLVNGILVNDEDHVTKL